MVRRGPTVSTNQLEQRATAAVCQDLETEADGPNDGRTDGRVDLFPIFFLVVGATRRSWIHPALCLSLQEAAGLV